MLVEDFTLIIHLFNKQLNRTYCLLVILCDKKIAKKNYHPLLFGGKYYVHRSVFLEGGRESRPNKVKSKVCGILLEIYDHFGLLFSHTNTCTHSLVESFCIHLYWQ